MACQMHVEVIFYRNKSKFAIYRICCSYVCVQIGGKC